MSVNGFPRTPQVPVALLSHDAWGRPAPEGYGFDAATGQLVQLAYPAHANVDPNLPWDFNNPMYQALYRGDVTIENQPRPMGAPAQHGQQYDTLHPLPKTHADVALVSKDSYYKEGDRNEPIPVDDMGTLFAFAAGEIAGVARVKYRFSQSLLAYIQVPSPDDTNSLQVVTPGQPQLLNVSAKQDAVNAPPVGGACIITALEFGHQGFQHRVWFDSPQAQTVRIPFGGSFGRLITILAPKYYTNDDNNLVANTRVYLLTPGGPQLTNQLWNNLDQNVIVKNGFPTPNTTPANGNKVTVKGYFSRTPLALLDITQPVRRFYGSVKCTGVVAAQPTRCPVAWDATQVKLIGGTTTAGAITLQFRILGLTSTGAVTQTWGPFNPNETITMPVGATAVEVINSPTAANNVELPFELDYTLSF